MADTDVLLHFSLHPRSKVEPSQLAMRKILQQFLSTILAVSPAMWGDS
jgi:hypothetical protein